MAIRYSGDVEVRIAWIGDEKAHGHYEVSLRTPFATWRSRVRIKDAKGQAPESYDRVAQVVLEAARAREQGLPVELQPARILGRRRRIIVRRIFQAPCPAQTRES